MKTTILITGILCFICLHNGNAQGVDTPVGAVPVTGNEKIDHNEHGQLTEFKDFNNNVDLSTGSIHPNFRLLQIKGNKLNTDISITYNSKSNRVDEIGSELGQGWNLESGGFITREVRGVPDESTVFNAVPSAADQADCDGLSVANGDMERCYFDKGYFHMGVLGKSHRKGYLDYMVRNCVGNLCSFTSLFGDRDENYTYAEFIDDFVVRPIFDHSYPTESFLNIDWCRINNQLCIAENWGFYYTGVFNWTFYSANTFFTHDTEPDVFHFSLGNGISGEFVFNANSEPVLIEDNGLKIIPAIGKNKGPSNSWIIISTDGTQYHFENTDAFREESWSYYDNHPWFDDDNAGGLTTFVDESKSISRYISKWHISKIVHVTGEEINFQYYDQPDLSYTLPSSVQLDYHPANQNGTISEWGQSKLYNRTNVFERKKRKSIERISTRLGEVNFTYATASTAMSNFHHLEEITATNYLNDEIKRFDLRYEEIDSGPCSNTDSDVRKYLKELQETTNGDTKPIYEFFYDHSETLPCMGASQQDFWGYYNRNTTANRIPPTRSFVGAVPHDLSGADLSPDLSRSGAGLLKEIHQPLGGISVFNYELHDYAEVGGNETIGGGLRVSSITNYTSTSRDEGVKTEYTYRKANDLTKSSATKMDFGRNHEMYYYRLSHAPNFKIYTARTTSPKYHKYLGEPVRYSNVIVEQTDIDGNSGVGKQIFYLNDFVTNPDIENSKYRADFFDPNKGFEAYAGPYATTTPNPAAPNVSKSHERGVVNKVETYNQSGVLVKEEEFNYSFKPGEEIYGYSVSNPNEILWIPIAWNEENEGLIEIYHHATGSYSMDSKLTKQYDLLGQNPITSLESYTYHSNYPSFIKSIATTLSDGETKKDIFNYAFNFQGDLVFENMVNYNIISGPIELVTEVDDKVTNAQVYDYDCFNCDLVTGTLYPGFFSVSEVFSLDTPIPINDYSFATNSFTIDERLTSTERFEAFDDYGNLLQSSNRQGIATSYIWGYNGEFPVATIVNATLTQIEAAGVSMDTRTEGITESDREMIASIPGVQISTYKFLPGIGMSEVVDENGLTFYYQYDAFNRIERIVDHEGNVLKQFEYNYAND